MKTNRIDWKKIDKEDWKSFKKWMKGEKYILQDNFYTNFFNVNNQVKLKKYTVEFLTYNMIKLENRYKEMGIPVELKIFEGNELVTFLKDALIKSCIVEVRTEMTKFINTVFEIIEYKINNKKDWEKEYELLNKYNLSVNEMYENRVVEFNKWIQFANKYLYIKQKGFIKDNVK